jgi:anti-sigma factor RsiW
MRTVIPYISTADLSAYLDGELDEDRRMAVEGVLAENPEMADRLSEYQRRDAALRLAFSEFSSPIAISPPHRVRFLGWRTWAAAVACCAVLGGGSWIFADLLVRNREVARLLHDATSAHMLYLKHVGPDYADRLTRVSPELTRLLGGDSKSPDLSVFGFHLVRELKLPDHERPAILFAYRNGSGQLISCYFQLAHGSNKTPFLSGEKAGFQVSYRLTPQLDYAVVGTLPVNQLQQIADAADTGIVDDSENISRPSIKAGR